MFVQSACQGLQLPPSAGLLQLFGAPKTYSHNLPESSGFTLPGVTSLPALSPVILCGLLSVVCRVEVESLTQVGLGLTAALPRPPEGWNYINDTRALKRFIVF